MGLENLSSFASILIFGSREARSWGDRAKKIGSPHPRSREGSRGDRNWAVKEGPSPQLAVPSRPVRSRTPPAGQGEGGEGGPGLSRSEGPGPGNREGPRRGQARAAGGRAEPRRPRAATLDAHPRGSPGLGRRRRRRRRGGSFELGPLGATGGPCAALTVGGLQGAKTLASGAPRAVIASFPGPLLRWQRSR